MRIVFHGANPVAFSGGFAALLDRPATISLLPDKFESEADKKTYREADIIVGVAYAESFPRPEALRLFHAPAAGYDAIDFDAVPPGAVICNCFGHEQAIAEYTMAALLNRAAPLADADRRLRQGDWAYWAGAPERTHDEIAGTTIGLLGFGHIGMAIAARAKAFEMRVHVANRSPVAPSPLVDQAFGLDQLDAFYGSVDAVVVSVPLTPATTGFVGARAFAAMRPHAVVINVGRGPTIDEQALYDALKSERIGGAVIDTWYQYPTPGAPSVLPSRLPFHQLPNLVMTPHMSGWTKGTITRRQRTIAQNIANVRDGRPCVNVVRAAKN